MILYGLLAASDVIFLELPRLAQHETSIIKVFPTSETFSYQIIETYIFLMLL
jgi:hypothetical protein